MKTNPNEPAMPIKDVGITVYNGGKDFHISGDPSKADFNTNFGGLTKREHFAAMALSGLCNDVFAQDGHELTKSDNVARRAVRVADALIEALNKDKP